MDRSDLSKTSFEMLKANECKTREDVRHLNRSTMRGTLPTTANTINQIENMIATTGNWIEL